MLDRDSFMKTIRTARDKEIPQGYHAMTPAEVDELNQNPENSPWMPRQEPGIRNSNALFYELLIEEKFDPGKEVFSLRMEAGKNNFGEKRSEERRVGKEWRGKKKEDAWRE